MRCWTRVSVVCMTVLAVVSGAGAAEYETPKSRSVKEALPPALAKGPDYTVADPVGADGYMYQFRVNSPHGAFEVTGTGALRKLIREIWAIGQLKQITGSKVFLQSALKSGTKSLQFGKDLITNPSDTLTGIPKGVGRLFSNVSTSVTSEQDPSQESRAKELLLVGSYKRDYAALYGVDPYSSNPALQKELNSIGWAGALGNWTASAAMTPIGGPASTALTVTGLSKSVNDLLKAEPPSRIRVINEEKLKTMGMPAELAKQFLDHSVYTPRHDLILVDSLARLGTAAGRDGYLRAALAAESEAEANFFVNTAQIMRGYHETRSPITQITMVNVLPVALTKGGAALIPFALDYGVWSVNADRISQNLKSSYRAQGFNGQFELWVAGSLSPRARQELGARGFTLVEQVGGRIDIVD